MQEIKKDDIENSNGVQIESVPNSTVNLDSISFDSQNSLHSARSVQDVLHRYSVFEGGKYQGRDKTASKKNRDHGGSKSRKQYDEEPVF